MDEQAQSNNKLTLKLVAAVLVMFGFGFALVPLYDIMCDTLGINGKTNSQASLQPQGMMPDTSRLVRVEFMAHLNKGIPWVFEPQQQYLDVHPGQVIQTAFTAKNQSSAAIVGQAVPSIAPGIAASYFNKIECFCFNHQPLDSLATAEMPLIFYIEPDIPDSINTLTLSYTLYDITDKVPQPAELARVEPSGTLIQQGAKP
ncbi:cytochrome c oxidase assembly protein [Vibrio zhanjiangensis]|uniref:Cytochrome c oxidase assembly protein CtaG n=1 Tax=Vibrio zhanjiangensis TaxID=1046128 RepID=A0ABQ6F260_9VIBR|nr:cytochrome c oxidase assembly protein [Vibrio zhanjiangensis]GLT18807.1 cytochrome c oxidase assembly protein [Vibrio zhanjiangensis]